MEINPISVYPNVELTIFRKFKIITIVAMSKPLSCHYNYLFFTILEKMHLSYLNKYGTSNGLYIIITNMPN